MAARTRPEVAFHLARFSCAVVLFALMIAPSLRAADESPVELPPFLVEEAAKGPPWRYGEAMGYEVLARCGDPMTRRVVEVHYQLHQLLAEILPPTFQVKMSVPRALILYDEELQPAASKEVIEKLMRDAGPALPSEEFSPMAGVRGLRAPTPVRRLTFLPNMRLWDRDSMTVFMIVRSDGVTADRLALTQDYVTFLLKSRLPALPTWFVSGFLALHNDTAYQGNQLSTPPMKWISAAYTTSLKKDPKTAPPVPPLGDFFAGRFVDAKDPLQAGADPFKVWQAQAALFVRWGLDERNRERRAAFWKFVDLSATRGVSEPLFEECFGFDFAAAREQLTAYLPTAVQRTMRFKPARLEKLPPFTLQNASPSQVARIKGDWERLEITYVKALYPALAGKYLEQARRTLHRAYDRDERDPRLLAVMGLCEADAGNESAARDYLESAVRIGPIRPRAYFELARLRFADACAKPEGSEGRLSAGQAAEVLAPLFEARAQQPPLPEVYDLLAAVWLKTAATATRRHLAVFDEGVQLFPRRPALALNAAELNLRFGFREEAAILVGIAERNATVSDALRDRIAALRKSLTQ